MAEPLRVLVLGASGMLGHAVFRVLSKSPALQVHGSLRQRAALAYFPAALQTGLHVGVDVLDTDALLTLWARVQPQVVINAVGLIKQLGQANDPLQALPINAELPHRLLRLCKATGARLIHVSTDCVFSGSRGGYLETDTPDARDLYGLSKYLGEVVDEPAAITLRTSIIGHELGSRHALIDWFLGQTGQVKGYARAVFSGLPTVELAAVIRDHVLPNPELHGLWHVAAEPISKLDLLRLVAKEYTHTIDIEPSDAVVIDRSLNGDRFQQATGYVTPPWPELLARMHRNRLV